VKLKLKGIVMVLLLAGLAGCQATLLQSIEKARVPYRPGEARTLDQIEKAIMRGGVARGWVMKSAGPGHLIGSLDVRGKHFVVVDIIFNTKTYNIKRKSSVGLDYREDSVSGIEYIHPFFNRWIKYLQTAINTAM